MNSCPNCKTDNEPDAQFCTVCGTALSSQDIPVGESSASPINTTKKEGNKQKRIFIFCSIFVLLLGVTNIGLWFFLDSGDRSLFLHYFGKLKLFLWLVIHGKLFFGIILTIVGILGMFLSSPKFLVTEAVCLFFSGSWIIGNDFLAIPALAEYDHHIDVEMVLRDLNIWWLGLAVLQIGIAIFFLKVTKYES